MTDKPDAVENAIALLRTSETVPDHERRARQYADAFQLLNTCLEEIRDPEVREFIENSKRAYMRRHLVLLSELAEPDNQTWVHNYLFFDIAEQEVAWVLAEKPELRPWYDRFVRSCREWYEKEIRWLVEEARRRGYEVT